MLKVCFVILSVIWLMTSIVTAYYFVHIPALESADFLQLFGSSIILSVWLFLLGLMGEEIRQVDNFQ